MEYLDKFPSAHIIFERYLWHMIVVISVIVASLVFVKFFVVDFGIVDGVSMEPTYVGGERFTINKLIYYTTLPERQSVVQVIDPGQGVLVIKRIIGLPNETLRFEKGKIFLVTNTGQGVQLLDESRYLRDSIYTRVKEHSGPTEFKLGPEEYFIIGDNRNHSVDSRVYGPVHRSRIIGRIRSQ